MDKNFTGTFDANYNPGKSIRLSLFTFTPTVDT